MWHILIIDFKNIWDKTVFGVWMCMNNMEIWALGVEEPRPVHEIGCLLGRRGGSGPREGKGGERGEEISSLSLILCFKNLKQVWYGVNCGAGFMIRILFILFLCYFFKIKRW